jgi:tripartite-type tricarboxylate transporter receptor subunit TctC
MHLSLRRLVALLLFGLACCAGSSAVSAQPYPNRIIHFIVPFPAGGGTDFVARTVGQRISEALGQSVITDNRAGASGMIGVEAAARAPADGYTVLIAGVGELTISPSLYSKIAYDVNKDLQPVTLIAKNPLLLVINPKLLQVADLQEFIRYAKANPGKLDYGSFGIGSISQIVAEDFMQRAGIKMTHVPYKGAAPALQDLIGGQIAAMFVDYSTARGFITDGSLRALAVSTKERHPALPAVPTLAESGIENFDAFSWIGSMVPAGTPADIVTRLNTEIVKVVASPAVQKSFEEYGVLPMTDTPEQYAQFVRQEVTRWNSVVTKIPGLKLD